MKYWTSYLPIYAKTIVYMLQSTEYRPGAYLSWLHRVTDMRKVMYRRRLDMTKKARLLLLGIQLVQLTAYVAAGILIYYGSVLQEVWAYTAAVAILLAMPLLIAYVIIIPLFIGWVFIQKPRETMIITKAKRILSAHSAKKIAVVGSYGKTTAKEMLKTVLAQKLKVAATPGNMNTAIGISRFAGRLDGDEDILIIEMGEERPGDVTKLSRLSRPTEAIITGISEAHLSSFKTMDRTVATIFEIADFVEPEALFQNQDNTWIAKRRSPGTSFNSKEVDGWRISNGQTAIDGTSFTMTRDQTILDLTVPLLGLHIIPVAAAVAAIAFRHGLSPQEIKEGLAAVQPFEHRMQPRPVHGAWIIDDTYNGNSEGVKAGLEFLKTVEARRRVYVTPGLVEQGDKTESIHKEIGKQIAVSADRVYLMKNSVTEFMLAGMKSKKFDGELLIIDDPLDFYQHIESYVAAGDVVLMQNDWTDNYQ